MEDKRAQTLEALSAFIQSQTLSLARVQSDMERLHKLRSEALAEPERFISDLNNQLGADAFKLSQQVDLLSGPPEQIDWSLFAGHDPAPLKTLAQNARTVYAQRNQPRLTQVSELSELQKLVKEARRAIVDPILTKPSVDDTFPSDSGGEEPDLEEVRRQKDRARIRELKKRKIRCGLTIPLRSRAPDGVFIRCDLEDESAEVDVSLGQEVDGYPRSAVADRKFVPMEVDEKGDHEFSSQHPLSSAKPSRVRRPTSKLRENLRSHEASSLVQNTRPKSKATVATENGHNSAIVETDIKPEKRSKDSGKPKSETYKQSWSVSEQHLLERLLEEIPEREKNRWQKISRAMMGRRTPRQVASRVQKYFEKLKRFGVAPV